MTSVVTNTAKLYVNTWNGSSWSRSSGVTAYRGDKLTDGVILEGNDHEYALGSEKFAIPVSKCPNCNTVQDFSEGYGDYKCQNDKCDTAPDTEGYQRCDLPPAERYTDGTKKTVDIEYDLGIPTEFKYLIVGHHSNSRLRASRYQIYASNDQATLYNQENLIMDYDQKESSFRVQRLEFKNFENANEDLRPKARYVAMRVINPVSSENTPANITTYIYIRLFEFNLMKPSDYQFSSTHKEVSVFDSEMESKKSLIAGKQATSAFVIKDGNTDNRIQMVETVYDLDEDGKLIGGNNVASSKFPKFSVLTNGSATHDDEIRSTPDTDILAFEDAAGNKIDDKQKLYVQFNYELDALAKIDAVEMFGHSSDKLSPSHIAVSVAETEDALFTTDAAETREELRGAANFSSLKLANRPVGKFVGVRIICGVQDSAIAEFNRGSLYLRLRELSVFGEYDSPAGKITIETELQLQNGSTYKPTPNYTLQSAQATDSNGNYFAGSVLEYKATPSIRFNGELYIFRGWIKGTDAIVSNTAYTLNTTTDNVKLRAIYSLGDNGQTVTYTFNDRNGNLIQSFEVPFGHYLSVAQYTELNGKIPAIAGYVPKTELISFGSRVAEMPMWSEDIYNSPADSDKTFTPIYTPGEKTYKITDTAGEKQLRFDTKISYSDTSSSTIWKVNGVAWGKGTSFNAYVFGDMEITTAASGTLPGVSLATSSLRGDGTLTVFGRVNSTTTANECGIVYADGSFTGTLENGQTGVKTAKGKSVAADFSITLTGLGRKAERKVRAYTKDALNRYTYSDSVTFKMG